MSSRSNKQRHKSVIHGVLKPYCFLGKVHSKVLNQQNFRNLISLVFESVKFSPSQFFYVLQISLNVSLFRACFAWQRSFLMFSFNIFARNWRAAAQDWTTCACFTFDRWVVTCSEAEKSKQFLIPLDTHIILNAQSDLKYRTVVVISVVTFFFFLFRFSQ